MSKPNKKVLIIAYHLPPLGGVPVMRSLRLVRYLPQFGWAPVVLTSENGFNPLHGWDRALTTMLPRDLKLMRVSDPVGRVLNWLETRLNSRLMYQVDRLNKLFFFPDEKLLWGFRAFLQAKKYTKTAGKPDVIFATGFPWSSLIVGMWLKAVLRRPLVIDLRDSWSLSPVPVWGRFKLPRIAERKIMNAADAVLFTSEVTTRDYRSTYPEISGKMHCIHNGFDPDEFAALAELQNESPGQKFKMIYAGTLSDVFPPKARMRNLMPVLQGLQMLKDRNPDNYRNLLFEIYSNEVENTMRYAEKLGLLDIVRFLPRLSHDEILKKMRGSDLQVLLVRRSQDGRQMAPAKLYEYIATGKPILAVSPSGSEAANIVNQYSLGRVITYDQVPDGIVDAINELSMNGHSQKHRENLEAARQAFNGINLVGKFASIFDTLVKQKHHEAITS